MLRKLVALAILLLPSLALAQAHPLGAGGQLTPRGAAPVATSGNGIIWADKNASNALIYTNPAGTKWQLSFAPISATKGTLLAALGTGWSSLAVGANGLCLKADSTTGTGLVWASCGGGSSTAQDVYNASSNPVRITEDNTRSSLILRANSNGDSPLKVESSGGGVVAQIDADGAVFSGALYSTATSNNSLLLEAATANSGTNNAFQFNNTTALGGTTTLATFGSNNVVKATLYNDGTYLGPGATLTRDALATTTATSVLLRNPTASTGGATIQVSPALAFEGSSYFGSNKNTGARLYHDSAAGGPGMVVGFKTDDVGAGAYFNYGRMFPGYGYAGFSIGDAAGVNWLDFGGGASGASAIRVVAGGASHTVFDGTGFYPYGSGYAVGTSGNYFYTSAFRHPGGGGSAPTCAVGSGAGTGATCSVTGTDAAFEITINTGTSCPAGTDDVVTVTYSAAWASKPYATISPSNAAAGITGYRVFIDRSASSTTTAVLYVPLAVTLSDSSTYTYVVHSVQ